MVVVLQLNQGNDKLLSVATRCFLKWWFLKLGLPCRRSSLAESGGIRLSNELACELEQHAVRTHGGTDAYINNGT